MSDSRVIVALDFSAEADALRFTDTLDPALCRLKVGKELFTAAGPRLVELLVARGFQVFLDLKFHDIPNTVAAACKVAGRLGVAMVDVHALGGGAMIAAARDALEACSPRPRLLAVTVLTSMRQQDIESIGLSGSIAERVDALAGLAQASGADGVVCSAQEAARLRASRGRDFLLVTPGIRLAGGDTNDQARVVTPAHAIRAGADFLVVGRPVTQAADPQGVLREINSIVQRELVKI